MTLSFPQFLAVRPLPAGEFVAAKMKVAAVSAALSGLLILTFLGLWLSLWADIKQMQPVTDLLMFHPRSWPMIVLLSSAAFMVLTWRCLVSGLWAGLSGSRFRYFGSSAVQVIIPGLVLLGSAIWSDAIDLEIEQHPHLLKSVAVSVIGWLLGVMVVSKVWFAVFSWKNIAPGHTRKYLAIWTGATLCFISLAIWWRPPIDPYRLQHLFVLTAFLVFPLARPGLAPGALVKNRHR